MRPVAIAIAIVSVTRVAAADPTLASARAQLDAQRSSCKDSCCLAMRSWFEPAPRKPAELALARAELARPTDPRQTALALIVLADAGLGDVAAIEKLVDDNRDGGDLPAIFVTQQMQRCYPVTWSRTNVGRTALAALGRIYATEFIDAPRYREWAATHRDAEATFDYWYAQLNRQRPADPAILARLRARDPLLVARVLAVYCATDCGVPDLDALLHRGLSAERAFRWMTLAESFPEWFANLPSRPRGPDDGVEISGEVGVVWGQVISTILVHGEAVFTAADLPALERLFRGPGGNAQLAVLIGRLRPADAPRIWTEALHKVTSDPERWIVLEEAAARQPAGFADTLAKHFDGAGATAILTGLARAGRPAAATFARLVGVHPIPPDDERGVLALVAAARAIGCDRVPEPGTVATHGFKGGTAEQARVEDARARQARVAALAAVHACLGR